MMQSVFSLYLAMKTTFVFFFVLLGGVISAQTTDYKVYRNQKQQPTCTVLDSAIVNDILSELLTLDTTPFKSNLDVYYKDLGLAYYQVYLSRKDTALLRSSIDAYLKIKAPTDADYWNLMHIHCILGECQKGEAYLKLYREVTPLAIQTPKEQEILRIQHTCQIASQLFIDLQIYEQNGIQKAAAMASHAPKSAYSAYKRRFDYIILNTPIIHAADQAEARKNLFALYPDTLELKAEYLRLLFIDSTLSTNLLTMMQAIDQNGEGQQQTQFSKEELFTVASRFFLIDSITPKGKIQTHVCIGINGQQDLENSVQFHLLAAFCYEAIFTDFDKEVSLIDQVFEQHRMEISEQISSGKKRQPIHFYQQLFFQKMASDAFFQDALLKYYELNRDNLAFEIR
jgi:hypothetical protein